MFKKIARWILKSDLKDLKKGYDWAISQSAYSAIEVCELKGLLEESERNNLSVRKIYQDVFKEYQTLKTIHSAGISKGKVIHDAMLGGLINWLPDANAVASGYLSIGELKRRKTTFSDIVGGDLKSHEIVFSSFRKLDEGNIVLCLSVPDYDMKFDFIGVRTLQQTLYNELETFSWDISRSGFKVISSQAWNTIRLSQEAWESCRKTFELGI